MAPTSLKRRFSVSGIKPEQSPHAAAVCREGRPADPPEAAQQNGGAWKPARLPAARRVNTGLGLGSAHGLTPAHGQPVTALKGSVKTGFQPPPLVCEERVGGKPPTAHLSENRPWENSPGHSVSGKKAPRGFRLVGAELPVVGGREPARLSPHPRRRPGALLPSSAAPG